MEITRDEFRVINLRRGVDDARLVFDALAAGETVEVVDEEVEEEEEEPVVSAEASALEPIFGERTPVELTDDVV